MSESQRDANLVDHVSAEATTMGRARTKHRGVLFRPNAKGTTHRNGTKGEWWVSYVCSLGHRHREKIGPYDLANRTHSRRREQVRQGYCPRIEDAAKAKPRLFEDAAKEYETWSKAHKKSWQTDGHWLKRLKRVFAGKTLDEIPPAVVERFKLELAQSRTKATVNRHLALLRHLFNRAIRHGYQGRNPVSAVGLFREENTRSRWLTEDEERTLFEVIPEPYWSFCRVALYTGCRKSELLSARWDFIDWNRGLLTLPTSKSGRPRFVELSSSVLRTLRMIPGRGERLLMFPGCRKVSHRFPEWAAQAKLPGKVTLHTLRHTFASRLVMAGVDLLTVKALGGWNRLEMVERYSHLAPAHKRAAVERLAQADPLRATHSASGIHTGTSASEIKVGRKAAVV